MNLSKTESALTDSYPLNKKLWLLPWSLDGTCSLNGSGMCWDGEGKTEREKTEMGGTEGTGQNTVHVYTVMPIVYTTMSITISTSRPLLAAYAVKATRLTRLAACISTLQNYVRKIISEGFLRSDRLAYPHKQ